MHNYICLTIKTATLVMAQVPEGVVVAGGRSGTGNVRFWCGDVKES